VSSELRLEIPMIPPSVGTYSRHRIVHGGGKSFVQIYPTEEAKAWWDAVAAINAGRMIRGPSLELQFIVFLPDHRRRDVDNFCKCLQDALVKCGAIEDDSFITDLHGHKRIDALNPRTVIILRSNQAQLEGL
jgi:Holliday junction resolvase RusA-like endonuclease